MFEHLDYLIPKTEYEIRKGDIPSYFTEASMLQINMWQQYKLLGLPFSCGWAEHPAVFIDIISAIEEEYRKRYGNK
jgi:hypothetical protein